MPKVLTVLIAVGATWSVSQYLPSDKLARDREPAAEIMTQAAPIMARASTGSRSVALIDFAVAALPGTGRLALTDNPPAVVASAAIPPPPEQIEDTTEPAGSGSLAVATAVAPAPDAGEFVDPAARARLARDIQNQLRRVGCLKSAADGVWGDATKRAMQRFADRIEADLSVGQPDAVLLMLVDNFEDRACGTPCRAGEAPNARGRCKPVEVMATEETTPPAQTRTASLADEVVGTSPDEASRAAELETPAAAPAPKAAKRNAAAGQVRIIKTRISRVRAPKRARLAASSRKTRWSVRRYGLGVVSAKPNKSAAKPRKKRRVGASAAYRRWMKRSAISLR
jgi:hypothetical protein